MEAETTVQKSAQTKIVARDNIIVAIDTIFIQIVATAPINFSLVGVHLLIECDFGVIPPGAIHNNSNAKDWVFRNALQIIEKNDQLCCFIEPSQGRLLPQTNDCSSLAIVSVLT